MYDWANSVYSLVVISSLFPVFFGMVAVNTDGGNEVEFFGFTIINSVLFSFAVSFSFLVAGIASPFLTALADLGDYRRRFLRFFCLLGAISCMGLAGFSASSLEIGITLFVLATIGFSSSIVFYNSFLPSIATNDQLDRVSARGFAMGYLGSVLLLIVILLPVLLPSAFHWLGFSFLDICRWGFILTGLWWIGFGLPAISALPSTDEKKTVSFNIHQVWLRLKTALLLLGLIPGLLRFLTGFFWFNTGVQTIMYLAAVFGDQELHLPAEKLILTILILQLVAIFGARGFAALSSKIGSVSVLLIVGQIWILATIAAFFVSSEYQFYGLAAVVGLVMGGTQSMMRSVFAGFLPEEENTKSALFGFFDLLEKTSTVLGTLVFGILNQLTGNMRWSALSLSLFFLLGIVLLWPLRKWRQKMDLA